MLVFSRHSFIHQGSQAESVEFLAKGNCDTVDNRLTILHNLIETLSTRTGAHDGDGKSVRSLGRDRRRVPLAEHVKQ